MSKSFLFYVEEIVTNLYYLVIVTNLCYNWREIVTNLRLTGDCDQLVLAADCDQLVFNW